MNIDRTAVFMKHAHGPVGTEPRSRCIKHNPARLIGALSAHFWPCVSSPGHRLTSSMPIKGERNHHASRIDDFHRYYCRRKGGKEIATREPSVGNSTFLLTRPPKEFAPLITMGDRGCDPRYHRECLRMDHPARHRDGTAAAQSECNVTPLMNGRQLRGSGRSMIMADDDSPVMNVIEIQNLTHLTVCDRFISYGKRSPVNDRVLQGCVECHHRRRPTAAWERAC